VGEPAVQEHESLVGRGDRPRLDQEAARGRVGGVTQRADLAALEQRDPVVAQMKSTLPATSELKNQA